jgi:hypothetical protein
MLKSLGYLWFGRLSVVSSSAEGGSGAITNAYPVHRSTHAKAMAECLSFNKLLDRGTGEPAVVASAKQSTLQGATTKLELVAFEATKLAGAQKKILISTALQEFARVTERASPADHVLPCLWGILKSHTTKTAAKG